MRRATLLAGVGLTACTAWHFSGVPEPDTTRPVVRIYTRGGVEYGAATEDGILFLGRTAQGGPCRILYFLGATPVEEDGTIEHHGGILFEVDMDLKHQQAPLLERELGDDDELVALTIQGTEVVPVWVERARSTGVEGDLLAWPGVELPVGTGIFTTVDDRYHLVGLVAGEVTVPAASGRPERLVVYAGQDRMREALLRPRPYPRQETFKFRRDDITVIKDGR